MTTTAHSRVADDQDPEDAQDATRPLGAARPPVGTGLSPIFGQVAAALMIAVGILGVQEAVQRVGLAQTSWISWLLRQATGRTATFATLVVCVLLVLIGLGLLVVVVRPRPRRALALRADTGVFLRTSDLARLARNRVDGAAGVIDIDARATRRELAVQVSTVSPAADNPALTDEVTRRIQPLLDGLASAPRLSVHINNQDLT